MKNIDIYFFPVQNPEKSCALICCCPVQFFTIWTTQIQTAHVSVTILSWFCSQIKLKTSYNWEHLVEVKWMLIFMFSRWLAFECFLFLFFVACVIRKSSNKSYRACSVSVVNQKLLSANFRGKINYVIYLFTVNTININSSMQSINTERASTGNSSQIVNIWRH